MLYREHTVWKCVKTQYWPGLYSNKWHWKNRCIVSADSYIPSAFGKRWTIIDSSEHTTVVLETNIFFKRDSDVVSETVTILLVDLNASHLLCFHKYAGSGRDSAMWKRLSGNKVPCMRKQTVDYSGLLLPDFVRNKKKYHTRTSGWCNSSKTALCANFWWA